MNYNEFEKNIDEQFSGVVSISKSNESVFEKAYGFSDISNKVNNKVDTRFQTASGCKVFASVAILQLIEKNLLKIDSKIGDILDFELNKIDPNITVRQLLNHTSGVPDYFDESVMNEYSELWIDYPMYKIRSMSDLLPLFIHKPMMYSAGEKFQYNNSGYVLLGIIIEKITGLKFDQYVLDNIFTPCNMTSSGYYELDCLPANCANGYIYDFTTKTYKTNIYSLDVKGGSAGGAFITAEDMRKFWLSLLSHKLLSKESTKEMLSPQAKDGSDIYGYGVWLCDKGEDKYLYFVQGSDPGVSFYSFADDEANIIATIVSNVHNDVWKYTEDIYSAFC